VSPWVFSQVGDFEKAAEVIDVAVQVARHANVSGVGQVNDVPTSAWRGPEGVDGPTKER